ncbi:Transposon Tn10 TetD protein [Escherichia coli]|nr:Transposon Tn10 TetD protein [Escherichia coli]
MYIEQHSRYQNKANNIQLRYDDKQFHTTVIKDVLLWIEHNLDQSLLLDDVANKAGYTKWYFQRLFKKVTGVTLASYIRARRLTKAAVELRLTKKTILEIALKYQFDSQQSFTRRFKYIFKEGANKQVISSQADSLIKISRIWADFFPANTSNQPI